MQRNANERNEQRSLLWENVAWEKKKTDLNYMVWWKNKSADCILTTGITKFSSFLNSSGRYLPGEVYITWTPNISRRKGCQFLPLEEHHQVVSIIMTSNDCALNLNLKMIYIHIYYGYSELKYYWKQHNYYYYYKSLYTVRYYFTYISWFVPNTSYYLC